MSGIPDAIAAELAAELRRRREWDEPPCVYTVHVDRGRCRLMPVWVPDRIWMTGPPGEILARMAKAGMNIAGPLQSMATPDLYGAAFRCEMWQVHAALGDQGAVRKLVEDGNARRIWSRPDRIEVRQLCAVDRTRITYLATQPRGGDAGTVIQRPEPGLDHAGVIPEALDQLVSAFLGVTLPERIPHPDFTERDEKS